MNLDINCIVILVLYYIQLNEMYVCICVSVCVSVCVCLFVCLCICDNEDGVAAI